MGFILLPNLITAPRTPAYAPQDATHSALSAPKGPEQANPLPTLIGVVVQRHVPSRASSLIGRPFDATI